MGEELICGSELLYPRVIDVKPTRDYTLILTFNNDERRLFDVQPLLDMKAFEPLKSESFFNLVRVSFGTTAWPNDIDYCSDTLYAQSTPM